MVYRFTRIPARCIAILIISLVPLRYAVSQDSLVVRYSKGLKTESWHGGAFFDKRSSAAHLFVSENLASSRLRVSPETDKWKDEHQLVVQYARNVLRGLTAGLEGNHSVFTDKQSGFQNDIRTGTIRLTGEFSHAQFRIPAAVGVKQDHRFGRSDRGLTYRIGVGLPAFTLGSYGNVFNAAFEEDHLQARRNATFSAYYGVHRQFYTETSDSLRLSINHQRRDYYISDTGEIESRDDRTRSAENVLNYRIAEGLIFHLHGGIESRSLRIGLVNGPYEGTKRERNDLRILGRFRLSYRRPALHAVLFFSTFLEDQEYTTAQTASHSPFSGSLLYAPDNESVNTALGFSANWRFLPSDSLIFHSSLQHYRYDTPDANNFDDRDELRFRFDIQEIHIFSPELTLNVKASLHLHHFVYIYGERSADNNWNRIIRLNPKVIWNPTSSIRFSQSAEVLANYIDYDFDSLFPSTRSFLYRKFRLEDSTHVEINPRIIFQAAYRLELDENGKLQWDAWLEQRLFTRESHTIFLGFDFHPIDRLHIGPGYTYYSRQGYRFQSSSPGEESRTLYRRFQNHGPVVRVRYVSDRLRFLLSASTTVTETLQAEKQIFTRVNLSMNWNF